MCLLTTQLLIISLPLKVFTLGKEAKKGGIMSKSTFKILFYIRKNQVNKEGKSGIMIRLTSDKCEEATVRMPNTQLSDKGDAEDFIREHVHIVRPKPMEENASGKGFRL